MPFQTSLPSLLLFVILLLFLITETAAFLQATNPNRIPIAFPASQNVVTARSSSSSSQRKVQQLNISRSDHNVNQNQDFDSRRRRSMLLQTMVSVPAVVAFVGANTPPAAATTTFSTAIQYANSDDVMFPKEHGTSAQPVQSSLLYQVDTALADKICNFNRHFAEPSGYFRSQSTFMEAVAALDRSGEPLTFYDSVTGLPLFRIPGAGRTGQDFLAESQYHGWPSFRDNEVVWENVRVLRNSGEVVSTTGTHLGHNLPDRNGNRYCINLVSVAGQPKLDVVSIF